MTRLLTAMSDRLLSTVAPKAEAAAACTPRCGYVQYKCMSGKYYKRTCCIDYYCNLSSCGSWQRITNDCG